MYAYKIIRLIIIAIIITYFIGCVWFYFCNIRIDPAAQELQDVDDNSSKMISFISHWGLDDISDYD